MFAYSATKATPAAIATINLSPVRGARDESAPFFSSVAGSTLHRPLSQSAAQEGQSRESAAIASMTRWLNRW